MIEVELRAVRREVLAKIIEHLDGQAPRAGGCLEHERRYRTDNRQIGAAALLLAVAHGWLRENAMGSGTGLSESGEAAYRTNAQLRRNASNSALI